MFGVYFENLDGDLGLRTAENQIYLTEINNSISKADQKIFQDDKIRLKDELNAAYSSDKSEMQKLDNFTVNFDPAYPGRYKSSEVKNNVKNYLMSLMAENEICKQMYPDLVFSGNDVESTNLVNLYDNKETPPITESSDQIIGISAPIGNSSVDSLNHGVANVSASPLSSNNSAID